MIGYIYKTTNLLNNKIYVGQHKYNKPELDPNYIGSGKLLHEAIDRYGIENFICEVLEFCDTEEEMNEKEIYYIATLRSKATDGNYNLSDGGFVPRLSGELNGNYGVHRPHTEEERKHLSEVTKGHKPTFTRKHTPEECARMSAEGKQREWNLNHKDYQHISEYYTGSKMMTNGVEQKWVYKEDINKMLSEGWYFGSCKPRKKKRITDKSLAANKANGDRLRKTTWVHKGTEKHQINIDKLDEYLALGFSLGMKD